MNDTRLPQSSHDQAFHIPREALPYILMQRTDLARFSRHTGPSLLPRMWRLWLDTLIYSNRIRSGYTNMIAAEYASIAAALPERAANLLDIGCGVALLDLYLYRHYRARGQMTHLHLLDRTRTEEQVYYGFKQTGAFYNSLSISGRILAGNGVGPESYSLHDASAAYPAEKMDLVISLLSLGFHYPLSTYLDKIVTGLTDSGRLIVDVRQGTDGIVELGARFHVVEVMQETNKYQRILAYGVRS